MGVKIKKDYALSANEKKRTKLWWNLSFLTIIIVFSFYSLRVNPFLVLSAPVPMAGFLLEFFFPPNLSNFSRHLQVVLETLLFAVLATYISSITSLFLGILMSERINPNKLARRLVRYFVSFLRNIPVIIWAQILIFVVGAGQMVGLVALSFATIGFLSRSYAESLNDIEPAKIEALVAGGASKPQILIHGLIPEFLPSWLNWTLFSFEINIRASAILGLVGAGGIGNPIRFNLEMRNFSTASTLILILVGMVLITELTVGKLRKRFK